MRLCTTFCRVVHVVLHYFLLTSNHELCLYTELWRNIFQFDVLKRQWPTLYLMSQRGNGRVACSRVLQSARCTQPFHSLSETKGITVAQLLPHNVFKKVVAHPVL